MAILRVNPTRMELSKLKQRLKTSRRGHKLLKDKRDDLMKRFLEIIRENKRLREEIEERMKSVYQGFIMAQSVMDEKVLNQSLMVSQNKLEAEVTTQNLMSVDVPKFTFNGNTESSSKELPYGFAFTSGELDDSVFVLQDVMPVLLELAEVEKKAQLLAQEIEKTRRRVNALEYVQIPTLEETIKSISMKLDEMERGNLARLMKIKDMMVARELENKK